MTPSAATILAFALLAPAPALAADACAGIDRSLAEADKSALTTTVARQLQLRGVTIKTSLRSEAWQVLQISARDADDSFVIYAGDPRSERYRDAIGLFALPESEKAIRAWIAENHAEMPAGLAGCVAHIAHEAAKSP